MVKSDNTKVKQSAQDNRRLYKFLQSAMRYLEKNYQCSGVCNSALFYYNLDLEAGIPDKTCLGAIKKEVGSELEYLGLATVATGFVMFITWLI